MILFSCALYDVLVPPVPQAAEGVGMQQTRNARRLYVGGIPTTATDTDVANYFRDMLSRAMDPRNSDGRDPVVSVYMNWLGYNSRGIVCASVGPTISSLRKCRLTSSRHLCWIWVLWVS